MIAARQQQEGWGAGVIPRLALDLKNELPEQKGFSERNIKRMVQFWSAYPNLLQIGPRAVAQLMESSSSAGIGQLPVAQRVSVRQVAESRRRESASACGVVFRRSTSRLPQLCRSLRHNFLLSPPLIPDIALSWRGRLIGPFNASAKGAIDASPGQRPGIMAPHPSQALKGRPNP